MIAGLRFSLSKKRKEKKKREEENLPDDLDFRVKRYSDENAQSFSDYKCSRYLVKKNGKDGRGGGRTVRINTRKVGRTNIGETISLRFFDRAFHRMFYFLFFFYSYSLFCSFFPFFTIGDRLTHMGQNITRALLSFFPFFSRNERAVSPMRYRLIIITIIMINNNYCNSDSRVSIIRISGGS